MGIPVLPIIDLLIVLGWTILAAGGVLKAIHLTTSYRPTLAGLAPSDLFLVAFAFLLLSLTLAARTWVRLNEPRIATRRLADAVAAANVAATMESYAAAKQGASAHLVPEPHEATVVPVRRTTPARTIPDGAA